MGCSNGMKAMIRRTINDRAGEFASLVAIAAIRQEEFAQNADGRASGAAGRRWGRLETLSPAAAEPPMRAVWSGGMFGEARIDPRGHRRVGRIAAAARIAHRRRNRQDADLAVAAIEVSRLAPSLLRSGLLLLHWLGAYAGVHYCFSTGLSERSSLLTGHLPGSWSLNAAEMGCKSCRIAANPESGHDFGRKTRYRLQNPVKNDRRINCLVW
jgi:hypothetical protein